MQRDYSEYTGNEDHALFILVKERDREAFAAIYRKYHQYLYSIALKYLKNGEMAEDAVQHVFVKLWETSGRVEIEINLKNYLYTMTKNHILNLIRSQRETVAIHYMEAQETIPSVNDLEKDMENREIRDFLYRAIDALPPKKREVCIRKLETSDSNRQIADKMGVSVHTVKSHYQESLKSLRAYFQKIKLLLP